MKAGNGSRNCWSGCAAFALVAMGSTAIGNPRVELRPVNNGLYRPIDAPVIPGAIITGNKIALPAGGMNVELELLASDWGTSTCPNNGNPGPCTLGALQATIQGEGATSGYLGANANPPQPGVNLNPLGNPATRADGAFIVQSVCSTNLRDCTAGGPMPPCMNASEGFCVPNNRWVVYGSETCSSLATLNYEYCGVNGLTTGIPDVPAANAHNRGYFGTLILQVPASAATTYTVGFVNGNDYTFFNNDVGLLISDPVLIPAQIQVATGSCCVDFGSSPTCLDNLTQAECNVAPTTGSHKYRLAQACPQNGGPACPLCVSAIDCRDPYPGQVADDNLCTSQACVNADCVHTYAFNPFTECCDPETGNVVVIDDGDVCTSDACVSSSGLVLHEPLTGPFCDDGLACTPLSFCVNGVCSGTSPDADGDTVSDCADLCPGIDDLLFAPQCTTAIPTVSSWGLLVLTLVLLSLAKLKYKGFAA